MNNYDDKCIEGNCTNGHGTMTFANGDKYVGEFKDHKADGQGTRTFSNGRIERGTWKKTTKLRNYWSKDQTILQIKVMSYITNHANRVTYTSSG